MDKDFIKYI